MNLLQLYQSILDADYIQLSENAASYYVQKSGSTLLLLFEKSNGATDWKNNLDFPAKLYREKRDAFFVHRGFLRVWESILPKIADAVTDKSVRSILIGGYSHGAAIAALCHEYCVFRRCDLADSIYGYGFGCPRVFWGFLNARVKARFRRFTVIRNCRDLVTHLPPSIFGYRHVGNVIHIGKGKSYGMVESHREENYLAELALSCKRK